MSRGRLKLEDEETIRKNYRYIKNELESSDLLDYLYENKVISLEDKNRIHDGKTRSERNEDLLQTILHSGPGPSFDLFLSSLEERYPQVCTQLKTKVFLIDGRFLPQNLKIGTILGHGEYGSVYLATIETSEGVKQIAVKQMNVTDFTKKQQFEEAFNKETAALKQLSHKRIVQYYGYSSTDLTYHIYIEYMPGGSLSGYISKNNAIKEEKARQLTQQMLEGIAYIQGEKLFHRDIKSSNVLMLDENTVKLADFGLTRKYEELTVSCTQGIGTFCFMAPEMLEKGYNKYVDIWALGCVVLHMLTGKYPFYELEQQQVLYKLMNKSSPLDSAKYDLSRNAKQFLEKTFQLNPKFRPSAEILLKDPFIVDSLMSYRLAPSFTEDWSQSSCSPDRSPEYWSQTSHSSERSTEDWSQSSCSPERSPEYWSQTSHSSERSTEDWSQSSCSPKRSPEYWSQTSHSSERSTEDWSQSSCSPKRSPEYWSQTSHSSERSTEDRSPSLAVQMSGTEVMCDQFKPEVADD